MKCNSCGKEIPATAQVCPFCLTPITAENDEEKNDVVDKTVTFGNNLTTIDGLEYSSDSNSLNFGDLVNTSYDDDKKPILVVDEAPKKKKNKSPIIIVIILLLIISPIVAFLIYKNHSKVEGSSYYISFIDKAFNYVDKEFLSSNLKGKYKLYYSLGEDKNDFTGYIQIDGENKMLSMNGEIRITDPTTGLVSDHSGIGYMLHVDNNKIYIQMPTLTDRTILLTYDDISNVLSGNKHNTHVVLNTVKNGLVEALKQMDYSYHKNVTYSFTGDSKKVNMIQLKLDNSAKKKAVNIFYTYLINDSNFVNEYSIYNGISIEQAKNQLENQMIKFETKYGNDSEDITYINCYYDSNYVYGFEIDSTKDGGNKYFVSLNDDNIVIKKYINDNKVFDFDINKQNNTDSILYSVDGYINDEKFILKLNIYPDNNINITYDFNNLIDIRDISKNELDIINSKLKVYTTHTEWLYKLSDVFNISCKRELNCNCERKTCMCTDGRYTVTCVKE